MVFKYKQGAQQGQSFSLSQGNEGEEGTKDWPCTKCHGNVLSNGIECDLCDDWTHFECVGPAVKTNVVKLKGVANMMYMCDKCMEMYNSLKIGLQCISKSQNDVKKIVCAVNEYMVDVAGDENAVGKCKTSYADVLKTDLVQMKEEMFELKKKMIEKVNTVEDVMIEQRERDRRKTNIILHQVVESSEEDSKKEKDMQTVKEILEEMGVQGAQIHRAFRLGPKRTDGKHRLLLVDVGKQDTRDNILRRAPNLKKSSQFSRVFVSEDRTPAEQEAMRNLVREKYELSKNDPAHIYIIRQFRIVKIKKRENVAMGRENEGGVVSGSTSGEDRSASDELGGTSDASTSSEAKQAESKK